MLVCRVLPEEAPIGVPEDALLGLRPTAGDCDSQGVCDWLDVVPYKEKYTDVYSSLSSKIEQIGLRM